LGRAVKLNGRHCVEVALDSPAVTKIPRPFASRYEPSDECAVWLKEQVVYWMYEPILGYDSYGNQFTTALRFVLPDETGQLMFKLAWGGSLTH
jgi:hypothetical protein